MSLEKVENCNKCSLCQNQRPLLDKEDRCDVMWVGLSAKRVDDLNNSIPLSNDTNSGKIIELIEHKMSDKNEKILKKAGRFGPVLGGVLGAIPQCGFSVLASNLYVTRICLLYTSPSPRDCS